VRGAQGCGCGGAVGSGGAIIDEPVAVTSVVQFKVAEVLPMDKRVLLSTGVVGIGSDL